MMYSPFSFTTSFQQSTRFSIPLQKKKPVSFDLKNSSNQTLNSASVLKKTLPKNLKKIIRGEN